MTHKQTQFIVKQAVLGRLATALGKGFITSGKNFARSLRSIGGEVDQAIGYLTKNPSRVARGAATVTSNTPKQVSGNVFNPKTWPERFRNSWGAQDAGVKGFAENAAYAAGRAPAILTYGGALGFAPMVAGDYAGSAHGAASASKNLQNVTYDEIARSMQKMENTPFMERARFAYNPQGFAEGMMTQGDGLDAHSLDAYNRMFNPEAPTAGGAGAFAKDFMLKSMPIGGFFEGQNSLVPGRNWIENKAADMMAQRVRDMLPAKTASLNVDMLKQANLMAGLSRLGGYVSGNVIGTAFRGVKDSVKNLFTRAGTKPPPLPRVTPPPLPGALPSGGKFALGTAGKYALPLGLTGMGYFVGKGKTESDMYQQARGTARATIADQWMNLSPMERYMAAAFPQAARMKLEQKLGPEYSQYYQQTFGAPGAA
jgi:hypothetical protein